MMELARVKRETDVARATQSAMESVSVDQETTPGANPGADITPLVGSGAMAGGESMVGAVPVPEGTGSGGGHGLAGDGSSTK